MDIPETQYAKIGDLHIGYQVWGEGPLAVIEFHNGTLISIDETPDEPSWLRYESRLASFCRLIRFDYRGLGLSDPLPPGVEPCLDDLAEDALGLLDTLGIERAVAIGPSGGALGAITLAVRAPDRIDKLILVNASARVNWAPDYPIGVAPELTEAGVNRIDPNVVIDPALELPDDIAVLIPSRAGNKQFHNWWSRAARRGASPVMAMAYNRLFFEADARPLLAKILQPTLVISRSDLFAGVVSHGRYIAERITNARFVELPGTDLIVYGGDYDLIVDEIQEFLTGEREEAAPNRILATIVFTDIVGSTALAAEVGDRRWRALLEDHDSTVHREVARHGGRHVKDLGDGSLAVFDGPAQGMRYAAALIDAAKALGIDVRAGVHTGEVELRGDDVGGIAVHIGSRICALAEPGQILVSSTVKDLVAGSNLAFTDHGTHELKGVPGEWRVLAVAHL